MKATLDQLIGTATLVDTATGETLYDPDAGKRVEAVPVKPSKYRNVKTEIDGRTFDSKKEANTYLDLREQQRVGQIDELMCQVPIPLMVNGRHIADYIADFAYRDKDRNRVIVDVKSKMTRKLPVYRLKRKILEANGIVIVEV